MTQDFKELIKTINNLRDHHLIWSLWSIKNDDSDFLTSILFLQCKHLCNLQKMTLSRWTFELYFSHCINCWGFIWGYNGTFPSAGSWLLRQQLCGCSPTHPTAERRFRLTSAFNALPSMSSRTVFYCVGLSYTGQCIQSSLDHHSLGLAHCALKIGIPGICV